MRLHYLFYFILIKFVVSDQDVTRSVMFGILCENTSGRLVLVNSTSLLRAAGS